MFGKIKKAVRSSRDWMFGTPLRGRHYNYTDNGKWAGVCVVAATVTGIVYVKTRL